MKLNNITFEAGVTVGDWDTRPKTGVSASKDSASDGDYFQATGGAVYRYSDDIGEWVRPFIYDGTPVLDIRIQGSVLPQNESPAWTENVQNGSITTNGTEVSINGVNMGWGKSWIHYDHSQVQKSHFFQGYVQNAAGHSAEGLAIKDGVRVGWLVLDQATDSKRLDFGADATDGERINIVNMENANRYLEFYFAASGSHKGCYVYVDHEEFPSISMMYETCYTHGHSSDNINSAVTSGSIYFIGDKWDTAGATIKLRECFFGRY